MEHFLRMSTFGVALVVSPAFLMPALAQDLQSGGDHSAPSHKRDLTPISSWKKVKTPEPRYEEYVLIAPGETLENWTKQAAIADFQDSSKNFDAKSFLEAYTSRLETCVDEERSEIELHSNSGGDIALQKLFCPVNLNSGMPTSFLLSARRKGPVLRVKVVFHKYRPDDAEIKQARAFLLGDLAREPSA